MTDLQANNVAIVTGGSRGIGRAICLRLAEDGWSVAVGYAREKEAADEVAGAIRATGGRAVAIQSDVGDPHAIPFLFSHAVEALGPLGLFVANAGMAGEAIRIDEQTTERLRRLIDVNLLGVMLGSGEAVRRLSTRHGGAGGVIILLSSVSARLGGLSGQVAYATTKGAIETFTRGWPAWGFLYRLNRDKYPAGCLRIICNCIRLSESPPPWLGVRTSTFNPH